MKLPWAILVAGLWYLMVMARVGAASPGTIYFVLGSDTALWNAAGGINIAVHTNHFSTALYTDPAGRAAQAMDPAWRSRFTDSFGTPLKLTWWMLVGSVYGSSENTDAPVPNLLPLHLMRAFHGDAARRLGDEITLHYHTFLWSDYAGAGTYFWNQAKTFRECRGDFDRAITQSLVEEDTYTVTFRSGWHYMDNEWQDYINELWPYNMDNDSPHVGNPPRQPFFNILDWSKAPTNFIPFHPATTNYQVPGDGTGWNVRSVKTPNVTQALVDGIFADAAAGTSQVVSFWAHLPESFFLTDMERMDAYIHASAQAHPEVSFRYCTSVEAMQRWRGLAEGTPPVLEVTSATVEDATVLTLRTDRPIFQKEPFIGLKDTSGNYRIVACEPAGPNAWTARMPVPTRSLAKAGIAVVDDAGNLTTRILRWIPDEQFVDNADPGYAETAGSWSARPGSAWGHDSRQVTISPGSTASAEWKFTVPERRNYRVDVQIPILTNLPASVTWTLQSGATELASASFPEGTLSPGWVRLFELELGAAEELRLVMKAGNSAGEPRMALADVIRVTPLLAPDPAVRDLVVDAALGTATLLWTSPTPCRATVDYGIGLRYGHRVAPEGPALRRHAVTLTEVVPGERVQYQILSDTGSQTVTYTGEFIMPEPAAPVATPLFALGDSWRFSSNASDGMGWTLPSFEDASWATGQGLLWADSRGLAGDPNVQPKGTELPLDPSTGFPWTTYYARARFVCPDPATVREVTITNRIDDGAVFYLNGHEVWRNNLPAAPAVIGNGTRALAFNCAGNATCAVGFAVAGGAASPLVAGTNVLAVEVHNFDPRSPDITLGSEVVALVESSEPPILKVFADSPDSVTLYWNGTGTVLQRAVAFLPEAVWEDVPGSAGRSPYRPASGSGGFFRLRQRNPDETP
ncbi:MAG: hypothetical protein U1G08_03980 [Verrucomicrobiota bacterium]